MQTDEVPDPSAHHAVCGIQSRLLRLQILRDRMRIA
jgi:hypothetical protein